MKIFFNISYHKIYEKFILAFRKISGFLSTLLNFTCFRGIPKHNLNPEFLLKILKMETPGIFLNIILKLENFENGKKFQITFPQLIF
jgi:hypothetical protein